MKRLSLSVFVLLCAVVPAQGFAAPDRAAVDAGVRADVTADLAAPWNPATGLAGRVCLDGRPVADFLGDIAEYWINLECPFCGIQEPMAAQRQNPGLCVVVRHTPSREYGESLKKALSYEALKTFSVNAANLFWGKVIPKSAEELPRPYEAPLLLAFQEAAVNPEAFGAALEKDAASLVNEDIMAARGRITMTPTWVLAGIRFSACDFTAAQLPLALDSAKKARDGDKDALERITALITRALLNEPLLNEPLR
jgi:hypothetical protein